MDQSRFLTYSFLGIRVQPLTKSDLLSVIESAIESSTENCILGHHNLHSLYLFHHDAIMRQFYEINRYTHVDGMSLILLARMVHYPLNRSHRNTSLDWFDELFRRAEKKSWRIYFLGGSPEVAVGIPDRLRRDYPMLQIRSHHGYDAFSPTTSVYAEIDSFAPHIVLVGMGMPLQERWILEAQNKVHTKLFYSCGAIMDYYMGTQKTPPRWLGRFGLEWLYRLISRPKVLYSRYVLEPMMLLPMILREIATRKLYEI
jgi:N-acetylglucosaminyldiphosphoundecaprenol N-acetyl-beta-D-mannosaminyltransferase